MFISSGDSQVLQKVHQGLRKFWITTTQKKQVQYKETEVVSIFTLIRNSSMLFEEIKSKRLPAAVSAYANCRKPFKLHVDASTTGLGAVLHQSQASESGVIAYASRSLRNSGRNYPALKTLVFCLFRGQ